MESVNEIIKKVLDSFFDLDDQDKTIHISSEDSKLISDVITETLKSKGVIQ